MKMLQTWTASIAGLVAAFVVIPGISEGVKAQDLAQCDGTVTPDIEVEEIGGRDNLSSLGISETSDDLLSPLFVQKVTGVCGRMIQRVQMGVATLQNGRQFDIRGSKIDLVTWPQSEEIGEGQEIKDLLGIGRRPIDIEAIRFYSPSSGPREVDYAVISERDGRWCLSRVTVLNGVTVSREQIMIRSDLPLRGVTFFPSIHRGGQLSIVQEASEDAVHVIGFTLDS